MASCCHSRRRCCPAQHMSMVKGNGFSNIPIVVDLPDNEHQFPMKALQQHVPRLCHHVRESGNRRVNPQQLVESRFDNINDYPIIDMAIRNIFSRIGSHEYHRHCPIGRELNIPDNENFFEDILLQVDDARMYGDIHQIEYLLGIALVMFENVAELIRNDTGFGNGLQLFRGYFETAKRLIPSLMFFGPEPVYRLIRSVNIMGGQGLNAVDRLIGALGLEEKQDLQQFATMMAHNGDILGRQIVYLMTGS